MKKLSILTIILTCAILIGCSKQDGNIKSASPDKPPEALIGPIVSNSFSGRVYSGLGDQPSVQKLYRWDGRIVAQTSDIFFEINPEEVTSSPIVFVGGRNLVSLTTAFGRPFALGDAGNHQVLFHRTEDGKWKLEDVPPNDAHEEDRYSVIVGDEETLVLLGQHSFLVVTENTFTNQAYTGECHPNKADACALWEGNLYYGYDRGEFGGGLRKLDLSSGQWSEVTGKLPQMDHSTRPRKLVEVENSPVNHVSSLCISPDGNLKIIGGLSHMMGKYGRIAELTKQGLKNEIYISNFLDSNRGWEHEITDFIGLNYNTAQEPVLLTSDLGLLVQQLDKWERLTQNWPNQFYPTSFLELSDKKYLFGTTTEGVVLVDLSHDAESTIKLATSFYYWK